MNKDKRWLVQNDPGILRKKADAETDLFIFGYACKIFRDDQKALEMDQGKHLIPWMGDETLKVDRYDARGHLSEISQFEGTNQDYVLTAEERRIEQLCDEERYRALHHNEEEQEMYQEEELKRLKQALSSDKEYGQVAYQYETDGAPPTNSESDVNMEDGEPFVPSPSLCVPTNMKVPSTVKENQIIEKTAAHIASHGPQVEILIKTRQANNQKLNFLHVGSPLNPYYNFILTQIKTGRYKPGFMIEQEAESNQEDDHYLHPSLAAAPSATVESAPSIPSIAYKPSSDCFYNMLVNKIRHMQQSQVEGVGEREEPSTSVDSPPSRRKRRKRHSAQAQPATPVQKQVAVPPQHVKEIVSRLINFAHSRDLHPSEIAGDLVKQDKINLGFVEAGHKYHDYYLQQVQETYKENIYNLSNPTMEVVDTDEVNSFDPLNNTYDPERPTEEDVDVSGTENGDSPPLQEPSEVVSPPFENEQSVMPSDYDVPNQPTSKPAPVCFSIKKPKEAERLEVVSAFPLEETSSDEEGKEEKDLIVQPPEGEKEKPGEAEKLPTASPPAAVSDELVKTNEKERSVKNNKQSPTSSGSAEVIVMSSSQTSSEGSKSVSSSDSGKKTTSSSDSSRKSVSSSVSGKNSVSSTESGKKSTTPSEGSRKSLTSSDSSRKSTTSSEIRRKSLTSSESSRKSVTSNDSSRKSVTSNDSSRKSTSTEGSSRKSLTSIESRKSKERDREKRSHRKHKAALSCSPDKYRERDREKSKPLDEKSNLDPITKIRRESDDFPPFPEDPVASLTALPEENIEKKREERKKKVKEMIEKIKTESFGGVREENSQTILPAGAALTPAAPDGPLNVSKSFLPHGPNSLLSNKSNNKTEESKVDSQKDFEEQLREQVKLSLKKIAETALAAIPPINEDSCSQFEHSSAANSNGFETPTSCGRPMYRVSRTPSVGLMDGAMLEHSSSRSSSTVASRKSHKKKKHHKKKKKKRKGRSKSKKHHESSSESSSEDESSDEVWASSSDSDPRPKKRHKKSSKRSHKRHKRKHRRRKTSSSSSTSE